MSEEEKMAYSASRAALVASDQAASENLAEVGRRYLPKGWGGHRDWSVPPIPLIPGLTYEAWHPFKREEYQPLPDDPEAGYPSKCATWVPGWRYEDIGPEDMGEVWDGEGEQLRTVVSVHRPSPRYPERVFYTRQWRSPDGRLFGRGGLRCVIAPSFRAWLRGERWPSFSEAKKAHVKWAFTRPTSSEPPPQSVAPATTPHGGARGQTPNQIPPERV